VSLYGLDEVMEELKKEGKEPTPEVGEEILKRLEAYSYNYIPSSEEARKKIRFLVLQEYKKFLKST
jgi:hypothetical protein